MKSFCALTSSKSDFVQLYGAAWCRSCSFLSFPIDYAPRLASILNGEGCTPEGCEFRTSKPELAANPQSGAISSERAPVRPTLWAGRKTQIKRRGVLLLMLLVLLENWNSWGDVLLFRRPGRVVVINKQRNRTSECGFRAACAKREETLSLVQMYTRACAPRKRESGVRMRDILARNESWAARLVWKTRESENIMEHITNTRWSAGAAHTKRRRFRVFLVISLPTRNNGGAQSKHHARGESQHARELFGGLCFGEALPTRLNLSRTLPLRAWNLLADSSSCWATKIFNANLAARKSN